MEESDSFMLKAVKVLGTLLSWDCNLKMLHTISGSGH